MEIVTVAGNYIRRLPLSLNSIEIVYEELNFDITGIDVNMKEETIYWSNGKSVFK